LFRHSDTYAMVKALAAHFAHLLAFFGIYANATKFGKIHNSPMKHANARCPHFFTPRESHSMLTIRRKDDGIVRRFVRNVSNPVEKSLRVQKEEKDGLVRYQCF
jgi:hypothetical protein